MENENWSRQLLALTLLSLARAGVEWLTNPRSREEATNQLRENFAQIDYDAVANAITQAIENLADTSKSTVDSAIDTLRDRSVDAVDEAKARAEKQLAPPKKRRRGRFIIGLLIGAAIAYFLMDEQRRDDLLDRLTGASGPIEQTTSTVYNQAASTAQQAADQVPPSVKDAAQQAAQQASDAAQQASDKS
jgi:hypothetical protein